MSALGRLNRVGLRDILRSEAQDFTAWLAREDDLALLGETLGINLALEAVERTVGPFRADILCRDALSDVWVLIENQLERTDHTDLGQLMTYASRDRRIFLTRHVQDVTDRDSWPEQHAWLSERLDRMHAVFAQHVRGLAFGPGDRTE